MSRHTGQSGSSIPFFCSSRRLASTPLFFILFLSKWNPESGQTLREAATEKFAMIGAVQWSAIAEVIRGMASEGETIQRVQGIDKLWGVMPVSAAWGMMWGAIAALVIEVTRIATKGRFPLSGVGIGLGMLAGYHGGLFDRLVGRVVDTIMAFPLFVLAMGIVAALGNTVANIVLATAIINLPFYVRVARAETNVRRSAGFIEAARLSGNTDLRILAVHLFPNILPPAMVQVSLNLGWAILNAAGLSFIGLGVRPPTPEWGILVAEGAQFIVSGEWWVSFFPGAVLMLAVFSFNLLGDALRDLFDPRRRT
jgi:ABC-type dipeptide/oligopeptide/nickel transport system permease subunit